MADVTGLPMDWTRPICDLFTRLFADQGQIISKAVERSNGKKQKSAVDPKQAAARTLSPPPAAESAQDKLQRNHPAAVNRESSKPASDEDTKCKAISMNAIAAEPAIEEKIQRDVSHGQLSLTRRPKTKPLESGWTRVGKK